MWWRIFVMVLACLVLCGMRMTGAYADEECDANAWIKVPPKEMFSAAKRLDSTQVAPLNGETKRLAIENLRKALFYKVSANELRLLGIDKFPNRMQAFFIRGVAYNVANGVWSVKIVGSMLYVNHDSLGPAGLSLRCEPLLVFLDHALNDVFVRAGIDG